MTDHSSIGSISLQLQKLRDGESDATQAIFDFYYDRLVALARKLLPANQKRMADEEDVVMSVVAAFFLDNLSGKLPRLESREDAWRVLARRTRQRASNLQRDQNRPRRGGGRVSGESAFLLPNREGECAGIQQIADQSQDLLAELNTDLLESLPNESLREIAQGVLDGQSPDEIARLHGKSRATVYRKLALIRDIWQHSVS